MFKNLLIFVVVLCCCNLIKAQNVFNPSDAIVNYNSAATAGSASNPFQPVSGIMAKWVRTQALGWTTTNFKCYIWNNMCFRLRFPKNYNPANASKYPVIVFLHGGGEAAPVYDNEDQLLWGAQIFEQRINNNEWNGFLLFPQQTSIGWNDYHYSRINSILDTLQKYNNLDPDRVVTMGLSAGGGGSVDYARLYPGRIAAALPSSPYAINNMSSSLQNFIHIPIWLANGGTDADPEPYGAQSFYSSFRNAGGNIFRSYFVNNGHNTWTNMWNMRDAEGGLITSSYWNSAHKAQPLVYFENTQFCSSGPIAARMGITPGYNAYEWDRNGVSIPGANSNEYTATQVGQYRVRFRRIVSGGWSDWTPNPVVVSTKTCAVDTVFAEHFTHDPNYNAVQTYRKGNFGCQNGVLTTGTDLFTQDAAGFQGGQFLVNFTRTTSSTCVYTAGAEVWSAPNLVNVLPNTNYEYSFYIGNNNTSSRAQLAPTINGVALITGFVQATGSGNTSWRKFSYTWNSGSATNADLGMINRFGSDIGNEFALDEIALRRVASQTLPVTWLQVAAKLTTGNDVQVTWKTTNEVNADSYIVERSLDGLSFTTVAVVNASTVAAVEYQYMATDRLAQKGVNYYRIKQTDKDGKYSYSKIVLVHVGQTGEVVVWPNPAATTVNVQNGQTMLRLQCYNGNGQLVLDVKPSATQYAIPVQQWSRGVYYITITSTTQVQQARFIKN